MNGQETINPTMRTTAVAALLLGLLGMAGWLVGVFLVDATRAMQGYLFGFMFWIGLPLGCLALLMVQHLSGGRWGLVIRRILEAGTRTLPLMLILFIPIVLGMQYLYGWSREESLEDYLIQNKRWYLTTPFFIVRALIYFAIWLGLMALLNFWSARQDQTPNPRYTWRMGALSGPGIVLYALTISFAAVDWVMTIDAHWFSTIYGMLFMAGQALAALAFCIVVLSLIWRRQPMAGIATSGHFHDLGNLLLAFVMIWAYLSFSQFLITWSGNITEFVPWYIYRGRAGWQFVAIGLILFHFFIPFLLLLSRQTKQTVAYLAALAAFILVMRWVDLYWVIIPSFDQASLHAKQVVAGMEAHAMPADAPGMNPWHGVWALASLVGIGGIWIALFTWQLLRWPILPINDPRLAEVHEHV